jgi:hypothetical protein
MRGEEAEHVTPAMRAQIDESVRRAARARGRKDALEALPTGIPAP